MRQLVIVRIPSMVIESAEEEEVFFANMTDSLNKFTNDYAFITINDPLVESIQFEYPKNCDLSPDELDKIKVQFLK